MTALLGILLLSGATLVGLRMLMPPRLRYLLGPPQFAAAMLLPLVAMFSPLYLIFAVAAAAIVAGAPGLGGGRGGGLAEQRLRLLFFAVPLLPLLQYTAMAGPFTIVQITYFNIICLGSFSMLMFSGERRAPTRLATWDLTFAAMMAVQFFMDARSGDAMYALRSILQVTINFGLPYLIFSRALAGSRDPGALLVSLLLATSVIALIAVFESMRHWLLYDAMASRLGADLDGMAGTGYTKLRGGMLRARASFPESTGLSLYLGVALTMLFALRREIGSSALVTGIAAILIAGLFCTFARVGYIALGAGLCMCLLHERRFGALVAMLIALPTAAFALIALGDAVPMVAAAMGTGSDTAGSIDYRGMLYDAGVQLIGQRPLFGLGMNELLAELYHLRQGEGIVDLVNQPLTIAMRAGLLGGLIYFAMMLRVLFTLFVARRRMDGATQACACACFAAIIALMVGLTTTSFGRNETIFILLLSAGAGVATRSRAVAARSLSGPGDVAAQARLSPRLFSVR